METAPTAPTLYFDLGSPYAYLAVVRAQEVLGVAPDLRPVLLGAIMQARGHGSWAHGPERSARIAEIEARAAGIGLPAVSWPAGWPGDGLAAMRAAVWAAEQGRVREFALAVFSAQFARGAEIADLGMLSESATAAGLDGDRLPDAIAAPRIKAALRTATEKAWAAGVRGIPTVVVGDQVLFGDDQLETAAGLL